MADNRVEIKITATTDGAVAGIGQVNKELQALPGKATEAGKGLGQVGQGAEVANTGLGKARQGVQSISESLSAAKSQLVAFLSAQLGLSAVKDVAQTADAYNNLQGRIKLATGEGAAFTAAFDQVVEVSRRTNSNLEQTGQLFAKITEAGKSAGLSTQQAIDQALGLTETINQAIQLSGGSAESAKAAITQLIQGLQSGVLRGDEFNSVMEQSPRLAKALADGLGVTTGELRKMAEAGSLSADTVMAALRGQADTLKREFATLPPTVGRALENLSTSWTLYIGETDKATGASKLAAGAIDALASNLGTLAGLLMDAGQAAAAFTALKLAQQFLGIGAAATQSAAAVVSHTAAVTAAGAAGTNAAAGVGRFATVLASLRTFTLLGIVTNFQDIGTAIGEGIAKLAGYKDRSDEIARSEKTASEIAKQSALDRQTLADKTKAAIEKQFELSKGAQAAIATFDGLRAKGESAADAIGKIGKDFDLGHLQGIRDLGAVLDKLAADGKLTANEVKAAWAQALNGKDLAQFEVMARAAFGGSAREAERLGQLMDTVVREAVRRTGLDFDVLKGGIGATSRSAINDVEAIVTGLDRLKAQGVDTGRALTASLGKAINAADSQQAIDLVLQRIEQLRSKLGDKITDGLLDQAREKARQLKASLDELTPGVNSVAEAFKTFGLQTQEQLRQVASTSQTAYNMLRESGQASAEQLRAAFVKAANDAIAANGGIAPEWVKVEAAIRGVQVAAGEYGQTSDRVSAQSTASTGRMADGWRDVSRAAQRAGADGIVTAQQLAENAERLRKLYERYGRPGEGDKPGQDQENPYGKTADGFKANKDGSAAGTFNNLLPMDLADRLRRTGGKDMSDEELRIAVQQAKAVFRDMEAFTRLSPGASSIEYQTSAREMMNAALVAEQRLNIAKTGGSGDNRTGAPPPSTIPEPSRTVNVNLSLNNQSYGTVPTTDAGAASLQRLMDELARAKAAAA